MKLILAAAVIGLFGAAKAQDIQPAMKRYVEAEVMSWAHDRTIIDALRSQNLRTASLSQSDIDALDQAWRAEVGTASTPTISPVLENSAAAFLRSRLDAAGGRITEVFVMDARGLNVAASQPTSDYWQGDEEKFTETFPVGPGAMHFGDIEFDESSQRYQGQVSIALVDPETRVVIGAMTIGLDADSLF
jgi:hypothetical protein